MFEYRMITALAMIGWLSSGAAIADDAAAGLTGGWSHYGGDEGGSRYTALDQITAENVRQLRVAWSYRTGEMSEGSPRGFSFQATPILAEGALYVSTGSAIIIALDPITGAELWRHDPKVTRDRHYAETANRGVTSWIDPKAAPDAPCRHRIFVGTLDARLIAVDGATGEACKDFGTGGEADLSRGVRLDEDSLGDYTITSPPVIVGDTLITGSAIGDNRGVELEYGIVRGLDARTGEVRWAWDPIPRDPTDPAHTEWQPEQAAQTGAANAWAPLSVDSARDLVFVPTGSPSPDFYGGERLGSNAYANSLVALRASTGKVVWHRQLIHHDLWDYDLAAQPSLIELERDGEIIPAVVQATKMGLVFTFNRETGEPLFDIEERPVPQTDVEGEQSWPTQPFPVAPPPLVRHDAVTEDDAWGITFWDKGKCEALIAGYRSEGIYTPPSLQGTIMLPSYVGGVNWGGVSFDAGRQILVSNAMNLPTVVTLVRRDELRAAHESGQHPDSEFARQSGTPYGMRREALMSPIEIPCIAPPWGTLSAVDMREGKILWQVRLGTTRDLAPIGLEWGVPNIGGSITTGSGLIFIGATTDNYIRAFDVRDGTEVWTQRLPAGGQATPMTYMGSDGRQYVVIAAGGHRGLDTTAGDYVTAFALPE